MPGSEKSVAPKFRRRADDRPDEVLDAALELFADQGFANTKVEQIAKRAGLSKGTVYLYFPSKQAIIEALVRRAVTPVAERALAHAGAFAGDPRNGISAALRQLAHGLADVRILAIPKLVVREAALVPELAQMYRHEVLDRVLPAIEMLIQRGIDAGYFRQVDANLTLRSLIGPILVHLMLADVFDISPPEGLSFDRLIENHLTILFDGLSAPEQVGAP
ncbi:TetR/AcrR family transcriptional regulator [Devosia rhodophyticola]|uniref:TetR/AcrR family transcriptional regulator n=1 Tax=Devosia rhodophyticola TaxID=3026423 RepID=A0ABY7YTN4_9HYPH|nr:TetR/AcrR family transcriptional regulator [Devosia rhodophyticola]WDR04552.1 TetR/AcrR family transcriptional regulator [Devosia rhodophyticola]